MMNRTLFALLACTVASGGCANLEPVGKFGASGLELTKVYRPLVQDIDGVCEARVASLAIANPGVYDYEFERNRSKETCASLGKQKPKMLVFATAVEAYSNALIALAGLPSDSLAADLDAFNNAAKALKTGASDPSNPSVPKVLIDPKEADALTGILKVLAELAVARKTDAAAKQALVDGREPLAVLVGAMVTYTEGALRTEIKAANATASSRLKYLVNASNAIADEKGNTTEPIRRAVPYRTLQPYYLAIVEDAKARETVLDQFKKAAQALVATNDDLAMNYDKLTQRGRSDAIKDLITKIQILRSSFQAL